MPHFGLIDATAMTESEAELLRVRLHWRGGRERFARGMSGAGIASLYDALAHAMRWYVAHPARPRGLGISGAELGDDASLYGALARRGVLDPAFDFAEFESSVEKSIDGETYEFDHEGVLNRIEDALTRLGVLPFDESTLPAGGA